MYRIELDDADALAAFARLIAAGENLSPAMLPISEAMLDSIQQAFADQADPVTRTPWDDLSEVRVRQRGGDRRPILQDTGRLAASFAAGRKHGSNFAEVGSDVVYALTHQKGAKKGEFGTSSGGHPIPWGDIPARPMAGFSDDLNEDILDILGRFLTRQVR